MSEEYHRKNEPVKILFVLPNLDLAGAQKVVVELIRGLDRDRYEPHVCCLQGFGYYEDLLRQWDVQLFDIHPSGLHDLGFVWRIARLIQENDIQGVNTHQHLFDFWITVSAKLSGIPCVVTKHSLFEPGTGLERWGRIALERFTQMLAVRYVAVSNSVRDYLVSTYCLKESSIEVVHNGMSFDSYRPDSQLRQEMRGALGKSSSEWLVGTVANLRPAKGYETLMEALPLIMKACPNTSFIWIGRNIGGFRERLVRRAKELGVADYIEFTGKRDDVADILRALDLFVLPSYREGLPYVILEAMATGVPVVATAVGGVPEVIVDGKTGLLVRPRDIEGLASAIIKLINNQQMASELGCAGRDHVLSRFSADRMAKHYQEVFDACITSDTMDRKVLNA